MSKFQKSTKRELEVLKELRGHGIVANIVKSSDKKAGYILAIDTRAQTIRLIQVRAKPRATFRVNRDAIVRPGFTFITSTASFEGLVKDR